MTAAFLITEMDRLGYDVVTIGERDLQFGQRFYLDAFQGTKIEVVSANLVFADTKKRFAKPYVIRKMGNARVAITGLLGADLRFRARSDERALEVLDPVITAKRLIPELRGKADVVVLLSHLGLLESQKLSIEVPGIDVMIFGHQVGLYRSLVKTQGAITVRGGDRGQYAPTVHLVVEDGSITSFDGDIVELNDKVPDDEAMAARVGEFSDNLNARFARATEQKAAEAARATAGQLTGDRYLGEATCRRCHEAEYQKYVSQAHAHAFETLVKIQRDATPECLTCHVLGYGRPGGFISRQATPDRVNVQCESCHGIGSDHPQAGAFVSPEVCLTCHNPTNDPEFEYDVARTKVKHWQ